MAILKIKDKGVWKEIQAIKGDTGHDVYVGDKSKAPSEAKLIIEPVKGTATGTDIQVTDSANDRVSKLVLDGKSTQETRSGKNLLKPLNTTSNGITTTYDKNGVGTIKGTSTSSWADISARVLYSYPAGNYVLSIDEPKTFNVNIKGTYTDKEVFEFSIFKGSKTRNVAFKKEVYSMYAYISGFEAETTFNETIKIQLEEGSVATDYEPYGVSPSPDYPSEIENVKGRNLFKLDKFTDKVVNGMTMSWNDVSSIILNGTTTAQTNFWFTGLSLKIPAGTYHLSFSYEDSNITYYFKSNNKNIFYGKVGSTQTLKSDVIIDTILIQIDTDKTLTNQLIKIQLEKGSIATRYVPYGNIQIVETCRNWLKPTLATTVINGITCTANKDGTYTLNGTATSDAYFTIGDDSNLIIGKTYKFVGCPNGGSNTTYRMGWNFHGYEYGNGLVSKKTSEARNVQITIFKGIKVSNLIFKPMFTENTSLTYNDYKPYTEEVVNIDLKGNELCSLPNGTKDELIVKDGRAKIPKRIGEYVFTGNESFVGEIKNGLFCVNTRIQNMLRLPNRNINQMNSHFFNSTKDVVGGCFNYLTYLYMFPTSDITSTDEFKVWLKAQYDAGTPVKVQYELETPEEIDLGEVSALTTYEGTSNITNSEDAEMSIEYVTNKTNLYYQNNGNIIKMNEGS